MTQDKRNYGLDLYRIMAMMMITILHLVDFRYKMLDFSNSSAVFCIGMLGESFSCCGVDCFALLTGFLAGARQFDYDEKWFLKVFQLWVKVVLWSIPIYLIAVIIKPELNFSVKTFIVSFFPRGLGWWYIYAYFGLLMLLPILSGVAMRLPVRSQIFGGLAIFSVFLIFAKVPTGNSFCLHGGYSCLWLSICFVFGQILSTVGDRFIAWRPGNYILAAGAILGGGLPFVSQLLYYFFKFDCRKLLPMSYLSPFTLMQAVCLLLLFYQIRIKGDIVKKATAFLSVNSLGIYLFQCHAVMWGVLFVPKNMVYSHAYELLWKFPLALIGIVAVGVFGDYVINGISGSSIVSIAGKAIYRRLSKIIIS